MTTTHFTAWLVNDPRCLDQDNCDLTVLQDKAASYTQDDEGNETPEWTTDSSIPTAFYGVTSVSAADGDIDEALSEARDLLAAADWRIVGDWEAVDTAYVVTVEQTA